MSELPYGWAEASLSELVSVTRGITFAKAQRRDAPEEGFLPCLRTSNVQSELTTDRMAYVPVSCVKRADQFVAPGDLLISMSNSSELVGKVALATDVHSGFSFGAFLAALRSSAFEPKALWHLIKSSRVQQELRETASQTTNIANISATGMAEIRLPLPPLAEQRRIVAKLEALTARTACSRADLDRIPALGARYKQAVLAKIFGELDRHPERLVDLVDPARGIPYGIVQTGVAMPSGVPTVRCGDVRQFSVEKEGLKLVAQDIADAYPRTLLRGGEVLLAIRGSVGNSAVVGPEFAGCNISREVAMIPVGDRLRPQFAMYFLGSPEAQAYLKRHVKGVAQTGINLEDVRSLTLPVPELHVQDAVVEKIDRALAEIDRLTAEAAAARRLIDRLDQAILAKAFRGELVPQDPADEPASVLLERIRAERAAAPKPSRGRRKAAA